ncbi:MAG: AzlC family ABC transporter permease [Oscillospiraceae bacterium]
MAICRSVHPRNSRKKAGLGAFQAFLASGLTNASAGGYAAFTLIGAGAAYIELAITELIVNARYLLMSCALSKNSARNFLCTVCLWRLM